MYSPLNRTLFILFICISFLSLCNFTIKAADQNALKIGGVDCLKDNASRKTIKILSIDGGGVRGIVPAKILKEIESKLTKKKHLSECFDVMAGSSSGGIIVLLMNTPRENGAPKYNNAEIVDIFRDIGKQVFDRSWWHFLKTFNGWISEKYSTENLERAAIKYFGSAHLRDTLTNVIIPAYDISQDDTVFFKSSRAQLDQGRDFYFKDVALATSAAPTYFKPVQFKDVGGYKEYTLVDGGVAVNNPTMSACVYALKLYGRGNNFLVVSIGSGTNYGVAPGKLSFKGKDIHSGGKLDWASGIISTLLYASNDVVDYQVAEVLLEGNGEKKYFRFQTLLDSDHTALDDASPENIKALEEYADQLIKDRQEEINQLVALLEDD